MCGCERAEASVVSEFKSEMPKYLSFCRSRNSSSLRSDVAMSRKSRTALSCQLHPRLRIYVAPYVADIAVLYPSILCPFDPHVYHRPFLSHSSRSVVVVPIVARMRSASNRSGSAGRDRD